jgi:hypothetical protein
MTVLSAALTMSGYQNLPLALILAAFALALLLWAALPIFRDRSARSTTGMEASTAPWSGSLTPVLLPPLGSGKPRMVQITTTGQGRQEIYLWFRPKLLAVETSSGPVTLTEDQLPKAVCVHRRWLVWPVIIIFVQFTDSGFCIDDRGSSGIVARVFVRAPCDYPDRQKAV